MPLFEKCDLCERAIEETDAYCVCACDFTHSVCTLCGIREFICLLCRKTYKFMPARQGRREN